MTKRDYAVADNFRFIVDIERFSATKRCVSVRSLFILAIFLKCPVLSNYAVGCF